MTSWRRVLLLEKNLSIQDELYKLRAETQEAFDDAKALQSRQKELEREQKELHQVRLFHTTSLGSITLTGHETPVEILPLIPLPPPSSRHHRSG